MAAVLGALWNVDFDVYRGGMRQETICILLNLLVKIIIVLGGDDNMVWLYHLWEKSILSWGIMQKELETLTSSEVDGSTPNTCSFAWLSQS